MLGCDTAVPKSLHVVARHVVSVGAKRRQRFAILHGRVGPGVDLNVVEVILAAEHRRVVVVNPRLDEVSAKLPLHAPGVVAEGVGDVQLVLAGVARQHAGAPEAGNQVVDLGQGLVGVGDGLLQRRARTARAGWWPDCWSRHSPARQPGSRFARLRFRFRSRHSWSAGWTDRRTRCWSRCSAKC